MSAARRRSAAAVVVSALAATTAVFALLAVTQSPTSAEAAAILTVFIGKVEIQKSDGTTFTRAQSGDQVSGGDAIRTGAETKAAITYPSGTVARLDSNTQLTVSQLGRTTAGGWAIGVFQAAGKSWNRMAHLVNGSSYVVAAPNSVTAEVRGTEFEVIVETQNAADGRISNVVRLDVFAGVVAATANRASVAVNAGQSTTTSPGLPPTTPDAITAADRQDPFTVFNQTADASPGKPVGVNTNGFVTGQTTGVVAGAKGDGTTDLQFTLGWPGSRFELTIFDPAGAVYAKVSSGVSPVTIVVAQAQTGGWSYQVTDIESQLAEAWWVIVTTSPHAAAAAPAATAPAADSSPLPPVALAPPQPSPAASPVAAPSSKPTAAPAASPVPSPLPTPSPVAPPASISPSPTPAPAPSGPLGGLLGAIGSVVHKLLG